MHIRNTPLRRSLISPPTHNVFVAVGFPASPRCDIGARAFPLIETQARRPLSAIKRILILKSDCLYGETLQRATERIWPSAKILLVNRLNDAVAAAKSVQIHLLLTGVGMLDGDALDFLATITQKPAQIDRVLVITGRRDQRVLASLQALPIDGVFDSTSEGLDRFDIAVRSVAAGRLYWSPSVVECVRQQCFPPNSICRRLTPTEQLVLAVIGDGSDDNTAAERLGLRASTILSVRGELHRKLGVQHRGELVRLAVQYGFVRFNPDGVVRPGFATMMAAWGERRKNLKRIPAAADVAVGSSVPAVA